MPAHSTLAATRLCGARPGAGYAGRDNRTMTWLILEALLALALLLFIVWWTMFSGRRKGEPGEDASAADPRDDRRP